MTKAFEKVYPGNEDDQANTLTKLEYFAVRLMQGWLSNPDFPERSIAEAAELSVLAAESLVEALENRKRELAVHVEDAQNA